MLFSLLSLNYMQMVIMGKAIMMFSFYPYFQRVIGIFIILLNVTFMEELLYWIALNCIGGFGGVVHDCKHSPMWPSYCSM